MDEGDDEQAVELVDAAGRPIGRSSKRRAHAPPGQRHRAVSVFLVDGSGRLLLQRRAATKYHSAGRWSNTCCGHPLPGEPPAVAASRRLEAELGLAVGVNELAEAGTVDYAVTDHLSGLVEREHNHLFVGRLTAAPRLNPAEVAEVVAVDLDTLLQGSAQVRFSPWFAIVLEAAAPALRAGLLADP